MSYCTHCGNLTWSCACPGSKAVEISVYATKGSNAFLSFFFPGVGQFNKGQSLRGFFWLLGLGPSIAISFLLPVVEPIYHGLCAWDAYQSNPGELNDKSVGQKLGEAALACLAIIGLYVAMIVGPLMVLVHRG